MRGCNNGELVGAGGRGNAHANAIAAAANIEFAAICDMDAEAGQTAAEEFGIEYIPNTGELYARDDITAVGICVQTPAHHQLAMEAIAAGRDLLTEKPMAASFAQAKEMKNAVEAAGLRAALSYQLRFGPVYAKMKELCEQIEPLQILFARQRSMLLPKYLSPAPFDGIMDFISHDIDMVPFLAGRKPTAVFASLRRDTWSDTGAIAVVGAQIEFGEGDDKTIGYISSSMGGSGVPERLDVIGKSGLAFTDGTSIHFTTSPNPPGPGDQREMQSASFAGDTRDLTTDLYEHWAACVLDPELPLAPAASYQDGYNALLLTLAIVESGKTGEKINLDQFAASLE